MTIAEFMAEKPSHIPHNGIIQAKTPSGELKLVCCLDLRSSEIIKLTNEREPGFLEWPVVRESMTEEEIDEFVKQGDAKP